MSCFAVELMLDVYPHTKVNNGSELCEEHNWESTTLESQLLTAP